MYQRGKIREESMHYEHKKHDGSLPLIGVNTFLPKDGSEIAMEIELIRSADEEKGQQSTSVKRYGEARSVRVSDNLKILQTTTREWRNVFKQLAEYNSLGRSVMRCMTWVESGGRICEPGYFLVIY